MSGFDTSSTALSLAKQYLMECESGGDIVLPKETLKIMLLAFVNQWKNEQDKTRSAFKRAAS